MSLDLLYQGGCLLSNPIEFIHWGQEGGFKSSSNFIITNRKKISTPTSYGHKGYIDTKLKLVR